MPSANPVSEAVRIAAIAHNGQTDKQGAPYILHVLRVGAAGRTEAEMVVGFLHDILEDTDFSPSILRNLFTPEIMQALAAITREPGETYRVYIDRVLKNPVAKAVKMNDLRDNIARLGGLHHEDAERLRRRYRNALAQMGVEQF